MGADQRIAKAIVAARAIRGLEQKDLARITGIPKHTMGKIERGQRQVRADELFAIAEAMSVPLDWFQDLPAWADSPMKTASEDSGAWLSSLLEPAV